MATKRIFGRGPQNGGSIVKQPGSDLKVDQTGKATYTEIWKGTFESLVASLPIKGATCETFPNLSVFEKQITRGTGGYASARVVYTGIDPATPKEVNQTTGNFEYKLPDADLEVTTDAFEQPIQNHPNFKNLLELAGVDEDKAYFSGMFLNKETNTFFRPDGKINFDRSKGDGSFQGFRQDSGGDLAGVQSYLEPKKTYVYTFWRNSNPDLPVGVKTIVDGKEGLRTGFTAERHGDLWKCVEKITVGRINPNIYT